MIVARFPQLAHWGAFTALVEDGRVVGCEPFARETQPSRDDTGDGIRRYIGRCFRHA